MTHPRAYLDHAASTPLLPEAEEAWRSTAARVGNPSSLHAAGRAARRVLEESRESIARDLGVRPSEVIFTSGGTESDNLAIKGLAWAAPDRPRILCSAIEHHAVLDPVAWLGEQGRPIEWVGVDAFGRVSPESVAALLNDDVALCTVMWANNEVGTIQPIAEIAAACAEAGVPFHTDAVQALGQVSVDAGLRGISALTLSGHKIGAPVGVGVLVLDRDAAVVPVLHGGGQERDVRSGTVDAASAAAMAVAVRHAVASQEESALRLRALSDALTQGILATVPGASLNGDRADRLPGNVHMSFPGCEGDALLMLLDAAGVECSTGSACTSGVPEPSHVLIAMGAEPAVARGSLRFSFGRTSTSADVDRVLEVLPAAVERASRAGTPRIRPGA
ncbi:MAG: cysteine desulfurase family protein [Candidatus Nanopelagicales bacterium]